MATQGLISIVDSKTKEVLYKIIVGCNGYNVDKLKRYIATFKKDDFDIPMLWIAAEKTSFGCIDCLVVMSRTGVLHYNGPGGLHERFRETFNDPNFNPRWKAGTADHDVIIYV